MKHNYIFDSVDTSKMKGDKYIPTKLPRKPKQKDKIRQAKKPKIKYIFRSKPKLWNIPDNF